MVSVLVNKMVCARCCACRGNASIWISHEHLASETCSFSTVKIEPRSVLSLLVQRRKISCISLSAAGPTLCLPFFPSLMPPLLPVLRVSLHGLYPCMDFFFGQTMSESAISYLFHNAGAFLSGAGSSLMALTSGVRGDIYTQHHSERKDREVRAILSCLFHYYFLKGLSRLLTLLPPSFRWPMPWLRPQRDAVSLAVSTSHGCVKRKRLS